MNKDKERKRKYSVTQIKALYGKYIKRCNFFINKPRNKIYSHTRKLNQSIKLLIIY